MTPASRQSGVNILKILYTFDIISAMASECENSLWDVMACIILLLKNFGLILNNKMAPIVDYLKIIKMSLTEILQLASSNFHIRYMARKASVIVILIKIISILLWSFDVKKGYL